MLKVRSWPPSYSAEINTSSQWKKTTCIIVCFLLHILCSLEKYSCCVYYFLKCNMWLGSYKKLDSRHPWCLCQLTPHCGSPCIAHKAFLASSQALCSFSSLLPLVYPIIYVFSGPLQKDLYYVFSLLSWVILPVVSDPWDSLRSPESSGKLWWTKPSAL